MALDAATAPISLTFSRTRSKPLCIETFGNSAGRAAQVLRPSDSRNPKGPT